MHGSLGVGFAADARFSAPVGDFGVGFEKMLPRTIKRTLHRLPERLILCFGRRFSVEGIKLVIFLQDRDQAEVLKAKVVAALRLIQNHSPKSYARIQKFIPNIVIFGAHAYTAVYISELKLCDISRHYALSEKTGPSRLALTLAHEATHGYLASKGIPYEEHSRGRIERICVRAAIAIARRLPDAGDLLAEEERKLRLGSEFWKDEAFFERRLGAMKASGVPQWLVTYFRKRQTRKTQSAPGNSH